jgi:segregation and condensation protein B
MRFDIGSPIEVQSDPREGGSVATFGSDLSGGATPLPVEQVMAILFVADAPATLKQIAEALCYTEGQVEQALESLRDRLARSGPLQVVALAGGFQLSTKPEHAASVANFLKPQRNRLGRSLMEVLAIVAYRQPMTVADIDAIRGVQSDYSIKSLLERRLIQEVGRRKAPGRPVLYGTTQQFLHQFNMKNLSELPTIDLDHTAEGTVAE